jgi:hypothetical protein
LKHGVLEAFGSPGGRGASREVLREMLARLETDIRELNRVITLQRITEDGVVGSYRRTIEADYDWLGYQLYPNSIAYAGFRCPGCSVGVYQTKRPIPIGQGQTAVVSSCHCVVHFSPQPRGKKVALMTVERWNGFLDYLNREDPLSNPESSTVSP